MNYDMQTFYEEFLNKMRDDQARYDSNHPTDTGAIADVVPFDGIGGNPGCPVWQVAYIVIARQLWKHYGDDALPSLRGHYIGVSRLMEWFDRHADQNDGLLVTKCYGDWMGFGPESGNRGIFKHPLTPLESVTAFYHVLAMRYMAELGSAVGDVKGAAARQAQHERGVRAWHTRFFSSEHGGYSPCASTTLCYGTSRNGSQTSNALGLALGAPPDATTARAVAANLARDIMEFGNRTTGGVVGMAWIFPMLDQYEYSDVALSLLLGDGYPSLGHMAHQNMTTLCENLACTFHDAGGGSLNHIMLGGFDAWVLASIGGLDSTVNGSVAGWRSIVARVTPAAVTYLRSGSYRKTTRFGDVELAWSFDGTMMTSHLQVPVGSEVAFHSHATLPGGLSLARVSETSADRGRLELWAASASRVGGGISGTIAAGPFWIEERDGVVVVVFGSGAYSVQSDYIPAEQFVA